jgi:hypothetical protein
MKGIVEYKEGANYLNIESDWQTKGRIYTFVDEPQIPKHQ